MKEAFDKGGWGGDTLLSLLQEFDANWCDVRIADNTEPVPVVAEALLAAALAWINVLLPGLPADDTDATVLDVVFWLLPLRAACV